MNPERRRAWARQCWRMAGPMLAGAVALAFGACGETRVSTSSTSPPRRTPSSVASASASASAEEPALPIADIQETDFTESDRSRDPFRSYENYFVAEAKSRVASQREVLLDQYSLDKLRLIGIVQRANPPVAMLVDPTGKGHTIHRGQFVGQAEVVQSSGRHGAEYEINWRVERIRDSDVVFVREDPQNPDVPTATKVLSLHPEGTLAPD